MAVTLDAGALVAADRNDRGSGPCGDAPPGSASSRRSPRLCTLAQAWRDGARQASLARVLCGDTGTRDVVDACIAIVAALRGDDVLTSDRDDLSPLLTAAKARGRVLSLVDLCLRRARQAARMGTP